MSSPTVCGLKRPSCPCFIEPLLRVYDGSINIWNAPQKGFCKNLIKITKLICLIVPLILSTLIICLIAIPNACCCRSFTAHNPEMREKEERAASRSNASSTSSVGSNLSLDNNLSPSPRARIPTYVFAEANTTSQPPSSGSEMSTLNRSLERTTQRLFDLCAHLQQNRRALATISLNYADKQQTCEFIIVSHHKGVIKLISRDLKLFSYSEVVGGYPNTETRIEYIKYIFESTLRTFSTGIVSTGFALICPTIDDENVFNIVTEVLALDKDTPIAENRQVTRDALDHTVSSHANVLVNMHAPFINYLKNSEIG